jgi:molybdopterin molybdotransferase
VLAEDILADRDYPPFNRSAMDGYAINSKDWNEGIRSFQVQEVIYAGSIPQTALQAGAAFKIMTGASVPLSADTVVRREDAEELEGFVAFKIESLSPFQNIARKGEDLKTNAVAISRSTRCSAAVISTLATVGKSRVLVERLPNVAIFTTGNEVKGLNETLSEVEIRNSNYYLIRSLLKQWSIVPSVHQHLIDDKDELKQTIEKALEVDMIILSGGVSAGDADYVPEVLEALGVKKLFHRVAIKPGKPFWCGYIPNGPIVFALPGNPFSSFVTFKLFIESYLRKCWSLPPIPYYKSTLSGLKKKKTSFDEFFPARLENFGTEIQLSNLNGSGDIRLGTDAQILAIHPAEQGDIKDGETLYYFYI